MGKISSYKDLIAWQKAHLLVIVIYKNTKDFPRREWYGLADQMRRAAVSVTSNIVEGFSRQGVKEKIQFYYMAVSSLNELESQLLVSRDVGYISLKNVENIIMKTDEISRLIRGLIRSIK